MTIDKTGARNNQRISNLNHHFSQHSSAAMLAEAVEKVEKNTCFESCSFIDSKLYLSLLDKIGTDLGEKIEDY